MWFRISTDKSLSDTLAAIRRESGVSQAELAQRIQSDRTTVVRLESGRLEAFTRLTSAFAILGYDLIAVPRGATVTVEER
jgi:DNA-binding XRE family transcriptional regulator